MSEQETCQTYNLSDLQSALEEAGYRLTDCGDHWRCAAHYRGGSNPMSVKIYKNTGVWSDFGHQSTPLPIHILLGKIYGPNHPKVQAFKNRTPNEETTYYQKTQTIEMDPIYPEEILQKLFPNYHFYASKGYSERTLKLLRCGLAGTGKMYRRMVFPIYDNCGQIIGFSGRKIDEDKADKPKWKHIGKKRNWVYPINVPSCTLCCEAIESTGTVILVESIGDMMALFENGIYNVLVTFGLGCSPSIISCLSQFTIDKIIIAANNDQDSNENNGMIGAISAYIDLSFYFNPSFIFIKVPPFNKNDLGDCFENKIDLKYWYSQPCSKSETMEFIEKHKQGLSKASKTKLEKILSS